MRRASVTHRIRCENASARLANFRVRELVHVRAQTPSNVAPSLFTPWAATLPLLLLWPHTASLCFRLAGGTLENQYRETRKQRQGVDSNLCAGSIIVSPLLLLYRPYQPLRILLLILSTRLSGLSFRFLFCLAFLTAFHATGTILLTINIDIPLLVPVR